MKKIWLASFLILIAYPTSTFGAEQKVEPTIADKATKDIKKTADEVLVVLGETRERRSQANYFALLNYSFLDLLIPGKYGLTIGLLRDLDKSWEFEYLRGTMSVPFLITDLVKMTDERFSIIGRSYFGSNSFNLNYGLTYFNFSLNLGDKLMSRVSGGAYPSMDLIAVQALGFNVGIGNRWTFKHNITLGIDWISWSQPVIITKRQAGFLDASSNQADKDAVENSIKYMAYFPRLLLLKLQLGILF
ncbi:MAG: hypothetical protein SGI74_08080 [Oligoflexia bacterium]|nr:hypothetical protein [Oligoflexia bacterium]